MQQGRVQLDADWNEQVDIDAQRADAHAADVVGPAGGSFSTGGFGVAVSAADLPAAQAGAVTPLAGVGDFYISAGRYSVAGLSCENERPTAYSQQPDLPNPPPPAPGRHLVYLDVFEQHVSAIEDPAIREVALGGPDTSTRARLVWQVRWLALARPDAGEAEARAALAALVGSSPGALMARAQPTVASDEPCLVAPGAGYRRLENQLYRVEIHSPARGVPASLGDATFKWSRDNGSIVSAWLGQNGSELTVESSGRDNATAFLAGDWVELTDDEHELLGEPGVLVKLAAVSSQTLTLDPSVDVDRAQFPRNPKIRRWNTLSATGVRLVEAPAANDGYLELEDGVQVKFADGSYAHGDYWLIPARSALGAVEWSGGFEAAHGPKHHYAPLAIIDFDGAALGVADDLRARFPALTELANLFMIGGNAQQAAPGQMLALPLAVGVSSGQWPIEQATVRFSVSSGAGLLDGASQAVDVRTARDGSASCRWTLGTGTDAQIVTATLLDAAGAAVHLPIRFHATIGVTGVDPAVRVISIAREDGSVIENAMEIPAHRLAAGLRVTTDKPLAGASVVRSALSVEIELPWPLSAPDQLLWGEKVVAHQPLTLHGKLETEGSSILWQPRPPARAWLETTLFEVLRNAGQGEPILAWLRLRGNFIYSKADPSVLLDADVFGVPGDAAGLGRTGITLPSGDGRRGGTLELWFWIVDVTVTLTVDEPNPPLPPGGQVGMTVLVTGTPNRAVTVSVRGGGSVDPGESEDRLIYTAPPRANPDLPGIPDIPDEGLPGSVIVSVRSVVDPSRVDSVSIRLISF